MSENNKQKKIVKVDKYGQQVKVDGRTREGKMLKMLNQSKKADKSIKYHKTKQTKSEKIKQKNDNIKNNQLTKRYDGTGKLLAGLSLVSFVMVGVVMGQFIIFENRNSNNLAQGTIVNGINLSGMTNEKAKQMLVSKFNEQKELLKISLKYQDKSWVFDSDDFEINTDIHTILQVAQDKELNYPDHQDKASYLDSIVKQGSNVNIAVNYIFTGIDSKIDEIVKQIEKDSENSQITFNPDSNQMFDITKDSSAIKVDRVKLYQMINDEYIKSPVINIEIPTIEVDADITYDYNLSLTHKLSSFNTLVGDSTGGRKKNVRLALQKFNGMKIENGQQVSFNKITGPHSLENGYKIATIIYNGQYVDGVGGGVCQASSTLYNALLLAGMDIVEVNKHTIPVKYVEFGLDAMVSEYVSDLKFINNTGHDIFIKTFTDSKSVSVEIYGHKNDQNVEYKTRAEIVSVIPHQGDKIIKDVKKEYTDKVLFEGEQFRLTYPRQGYETKAYLQKYKDGQLIEENLIRHEIYNAQNGKVIEGVEIPPAGIKQIDDKIEIIKSQSE